MGNDGKVIALCVFLVSVLLLLPAAEAGGAVHRVRLGDSIQQAIGIASAGDTIALSGGDYHENITIDVPVHVIGETGSAIRGGYQGHVVHITAPGAVLDGVHVSEAGTSLSKDMACILVEADSVTVRNCVVSRPLHGIYVKAGNAVRILDNRIEGRLDLIEADRGNGIHLWNSIGGRIERNEIFNVRDGIYFSFADSTSIERNYIHNVRYGLHYMYSNHNSFVENVFTSNVGGAALMYSQDILFRKNVFAHCRGFRAYGILYQSMDDTRAEENLIFDNSRGIFLNNSSRNVFLANDIVDNGLAIQLNGGSDGNSFLENNFINNLSDLILDISNYDTSWTDSVRGGNHWSSYRGYDLTGEGLGDVAHSIQRVFQIMETKVPEVSFFLFSPAAEMLEEAERALPILDLGRARDSLPLIHASRNEEVPWEAVMRSKHSASRAAAAIYLFGALLPVLLLLRLSRKPGDHR